MNIRTRGAQAEWIIGEMRRMASANSLIMAIWIGVKKFGSMYLTQIEPLVAASKPDHKKIVLRFNHF
jgi:hypothetical protein